MHDEVKRVVKSTFNHVMIRAMVPTILVDYIDSNYRYCPYTD